MPSIPCPNVRYSCSRVVEVYWHYVSWEKVKDGIIAELFSNGLTTNEICKTQERGPVAIKYRLKKLGY